MTITYSYALNNSGAASLILLLTLTVAGAFILFLTFRNGVGWVKKMRGYFLAMLLTGLVLIGLGVGLYYVAATPTEITVGSDYLSIQSSSYFGTGNINITASEISDAYVSQIGSGNLSLLKQYGTNIGDLNIGVFTLGNGATANVVSDNSTDLVIVLNSGKYVILGTADTNALVTAFSENVYPVDSNSH